MPKRTRVRSIGRAVLLIAALGATYGLFAVASMRVALRAREVNVPVLTGLDPADAAAAAESSGLTLKLEENKPFDAKIPAGRISSQDPASGSAVRRGRSVRVWVSAGSRALLVPKLLGETERTARARLMQDGLELAGVGDVRSSEHPADTVVAQDPAAGAHNPRVSILVNRGERARSYVMPDLIGVAGDQAVAVLRGHGLRVAIVASQSYPGAPAGIVIRQNPSAGFEILPDQPISLEVSR
jgi:beta-lactam-binding protein with PASTA domain